MFDGKIARTKKNRTADEKSFGIQIDSLCDIVCFGALPIVICYKIGMNHIYSIIILILYGLAGLIRLAYFNVMEEKRKNDALMLGVQSLLRESIVANYNKYQDRECCPIYAKESVKKVYEAYHGLGGNDVATKLYRTLLDMPEEPREEGEK